MNSQTFDRHLDEFDKRANEIIRSKGNDYTVNDDRLSNYKVIAPFCDVSPLVVWLVYFLKHVTAIATYVKDGCVMSESIEERFIDASNYCKLGYCLVKEREARKRRRQEKRNEKWYRQSLVRRVVSLLSRSHAYQDRHQREIDELKQAIEQATWR